MKDSKQGSAHLNKFKGDIYNDYFLNNLKPSKTSSKGKFKSYSLEMLVHNDDDRTEIFRLLGEHSEIKMVL